MSKSITIPASDNPCVVIINNHRYEYKAGSTYTVPDEVAALIEASVAMEPVPVDPRYEYVTEIGEGATDKQIPTAKAVLDACEDVREDIPEFEYVTAIAEGATDEQVPTAKAVLDACNGVLNEIPDVAEGVADATGADNVVAQLNAVIASLVAAGVMAEYVPPAEE